MIEFQNVSYTYSKGKGVTNLTFSIDDGDFVFLIGSTGSGKTTLMRLIYFDLWCDIGKIKVGSHDSESISKSMCQISEEILEWSFKTISFSMIAMYFTMWHCLFM